MVQVHDQIWMATFGGGIEVVDAKDGKILQRLQHDPGLAGSLAANEVKPLLLDRSGLLWIGTWGGGLQRYNTNNKMVRLLQQGRFLPGGLSNTNIHSVLELANGQILLGTDGNGIDIIDREHGLVGGYRSGNGVGSLPDGSIHALAQTLDNAIWVGTKQTGVLRLPAGSQTWQSVPGLPQSIINRFLLAKDGSLWVATDRGVGRWKAEQTGLMQFEMIPGKNGSPMQDNITTLAEDRHGRIWAGSSQGLWVSSADKSVLHKIAAEPERPTGLISDAITSMLTTQDGTLWLATSKGLERLLRLDGSTAEFEYVSKKWKLTNGQTDGQKDVQQSGPFIFGNLLEAQDGRIWSEAGIIDPVKMQIHPFSKTDGIDIGVSWLGAYAKTHDGLFLFGGTQGVAVVNPALFQVWNEQPPLVATELKINGNPAPLLELASSPANKQKELAVLILKPGQQNFVFEFAALDYSAPKQNRYQYRLQGYDDTWINTDSDHRNAAYGNLRPGTYTLQVRGSNRLGQWSQNELTIPIRVIPAFWQTWWFNGLAALLLASATWAIFRWRTVRLKKLVAARTADILQLGKIGQELTATLNTEQAFERVYKQVSSRLDAHVFRIGIYEEEQAHIRFVYQLEASQHLPQSLLPMHELDRPAVWCVRERRELIVSNIHQLTDYIATILPPSFGQHMETIVYLPLLLESRMIGCLSVQSPQPNAYDQNKIDFLRVLASYAAIAIANSAAHGELESSHDKLALAHHALDNAHTELANSHRHLQETQSQLIQSEKMASLGQLVANIAHEINTPIAAVKASGSNIADALQRTLVGLPKMIKIFSENDEQLFHAILGRAANVTETSSSREARAARLSVTEQLNQENIPNASSKADILVQLHAQNHLSEAMPLLRHPKADFILATTNDVASILNNARNINLALGRVSKIVFALNSFTLNSSGGHLIETDLAESLETVLTLYQSQIKKDTQLVCEFASIAPVLCHPDELNQVWTNLIYNALQAMTFKGTLTLGVRREGNYAIVSIGDTGCGIPESIRDKIFDPFFTTRPAGEGSGLGLDIVKKIVTKHHGKIEVESEMGVGSTFLVYLPYDAMKTRLA
jgi:signal transduction histidine kinase